MFSAKRLVAWHFIVAKCSTVQRIVSNKKRKYLQPRVVCATLFHMAGQNMNFRIEEKIRKRLETLCDNEGVDKSDVIRSAIEFCLPHWEQHGFRNNPMNARGGNYLLNETSRLAAPAPGPAEKPGHMYIRGGDKDRPPPKHCS